MESKRLEIQNELRDIRSLPILPGVLKKLNSLVDNDKSSIDEMSRLISSDQTLSVRVLKLVNSPFYGFSGRVSTVSHALILLGVNVLKGLTLSSSIFEIMEQHAIGLWEHSLGSAVVARMICTKLKLPDAEGISTAALLHDIGKVVIKIKFGEDYKKICSLMEEKGLIMIEAEREILQTDHAEIGNWIARSWNLPEKLIEPMAFHHDVEKSVAHRTRTAIVHLSDVLTKGYGFGFSGDDFVPKIQTLALEHLDLSEEMLEEIINEADESLMNAREFSLEVQTNASG
jgi:putative nucleotidyltransferase with HDIG domain